MKIATLMEYYLIRLLVELKTFHSSAMASFSFPLFTTSSFRSYDVRRDLEMTGASIKAWRRWRRLPA